MAEMRYFGTGYTGSGSAEEDLKEAAALFQQAANSDNALSLNNMAVMLLNGVGVAKNETMAFEYFNRSAGLGNAWGINSLAACYIYGLGVAANRKRGIELWAQAANEGNSQVRSLPWPASLSLSSAAKASFESTAAVLVHASLVLTARFF